MQKSIVKKSLVIGIIFLFIGISIAPSVTSIEFTKIKSSNNNDLVEITFQICKTNGVEDHKMFITQEQNEQLDVLIDRFKEDLENSESYKETVRIYNDMVVSIDELGILPESTNCKEVQELVTGENIIGNPEMKSIKNFELAYEKLKNKNPGLFENMNMFCLISGDTTNTGTLGLGSLGFGIFSGSLILAGILVERIIIDILYMCNLPELAELLERMSNPLTNFWFFSLLILFFLPLKLGGFMTFGSSDGFPPPPEYHPANGWVSTIGLNGVKTWNGPIYGDISDISVSTSKIYLGAIGFTGIKILPFTGFYFGFALRVKLGSNPP